MAKSIPIINSGMFAIVDDEDYELVSKFRWHLKQKGGRYYARCKMFMGYLSGKSIGCSMYLHRLILRPPKNKQIDHHNHNCLDCRKTNLRVCTNGQNKQNSRSCINSSSKYKGISWNKRNKKWVAAIKNNGKTINLGSFVDEQMAALAYNEAAQKYFGEYAYLNII